MPLHGDLQRLMALCPPPKAPFQTGTPDAWARAERELRTELPLDYKQFIDAYGSGGFLFESEVGLFSPFESHESGNLVSAAFHLGQSPGLQTTFPLFPPYPSVPGLLPLGWTWDADQIFWLTTGSPAEWPIILIWNDFLLDDRHERHDMTITGLLAAWFDGSLTSKILRQPPRATFFSKLRARIVLEPPQRGIGPYFEQPALWDREGPK